MCKSEHNGRTKKVKETIRSVRYCVQLYIKTITHQDRSSYKFIPEMKIENTEIRSGFHTNSFMVLFFKNASIVLEFRIYLNAPAYAFVLDSRFGLVLMVC